MVSAEFKQNVEMADLVTVRNVLVDYLIIDRTFKTFDEALDYACSKLNIIEPYDKIPLKTEEEGWDDRYMNQLKVALMVNFSRERIAHIKKVIQKVIPPKMNQEANMPLSQPSGKDTDGRRTGRAVLSEKEVKSVRSDKSKDLQKNNRRSGMSTGTIHRNESEKTGRTGKRIISETPLENKRIVEKSKTEDGIGTAMIVGGVAVAAVGLAAAGPIAVGTGIVIAGAGVGMKTKSRR